MSEYSRILDKNFYLHDALVLNRLRLYRRLFLNL